MYKKAISKRKWKSFVKSLIGFIVLCIVGCISGLALWLPHFFLKTPLINPLGNSAQNATNLIKKEVVVTTVMHLCQNYAISCETIVVASDSSVEVMVQDDGIAILDPSKDLQKQVASLQLAITNLTIEGKRFKMLDFRFDRPVITF